MANLNLSQFTEKLFVADADHTFIWDTAGAISKRVSRNSWLNSGTLTSDAPVTISQTWNNAAVAFTGLKVNAAGTSGTNSAAASLLLDLQVGGVSKFSVNKGGGIVSKANIITSNGDAGAAGLSLEMVFANYGLGIDANGNTAFLVNGTAKSRVGFGVVTASDQSIGWTNTTHVGINATSDTILVRDSASGNTLALRNSTNAQTFNVYGTYTSGTSYERLTLSAPSAANAIIGTNKGSGGGTARGLDLHTDGAARMTITTAGNVGIGTTSPTSKLQVTGGDVEIETVTSGIIMKAAGTATRYRITLNATGDALVFTAI